MNIIEVIILLLIGIGFLGFIIMWFFLYLICWGMTGILGKKIQEMLDKAFIGPMDG